MSVGDDHAHSNQGLGTLAPLMPLILPTMQLVQSAGGGLPSGTIPVSQALQRMDRIKTALTYVQAVTQLYDFLADTTRLLQQKREEVRFAVDLEGVNLGKPPGTADILQIHNGANNKTYIIDLLTLQHSAFNMTFPGLTLTLRGVLESRTIPKYFHDVRNDSNALWFHYQISLQATIDTQIMQNMVYTSRDISWSLGNDYQPPKKKRIVGLKACMDEEKRLLDMKEQEEFDRNKALFQKEDDWSIMRNRPMSERVIKYCTNDVKYLLRLVDRYEGMMGDDKQRRMYTLESEDRIALSQTEDFEPRADNFEERQRRTTAPEWHYFRVNDRRHLLLEEQIGTQPVCGPDCKGFWEQTHPCCPTCACHAACVARQQKNAAWYAAQTFDVKLEWCNRINEAHEAGLRFRLKRVSLREEESLPPPPLYMALPVRPLDDEDWDPIEQPRPSSPWEEEETEDEPEDNHLQGEASEIEDTRQEDTTQDDTGSEEDWQEVGQPPKTEGLHPESPIEPADNRALVLWNPLRNARSPGGQSE